MKYFTFFLCLIFWSCSDNSGEINNETDNSIYKWVVPENTLLGDFGPFPFAEDLSFANASKVESILLNQKVVLIRFGDETRIYPSHYVNTYEVINDNFNNHQFAITYCPITESIVAFNRQFNSKTFTLLASGYLYKKNQVLFDESTDSFWSQMELLCIKGVYQNDYLRTHNLIETTWKTAKTYFPSAKVFTGASIGGTDIKTKSFDDPSNNDIPIYGIVNFNAKDNSLLAYGFELFKGEITLYDKDIDGKKLIVVGNEELRFITSFINDAQVEFNPIQHDFPNIMQDTNGNIWNVFGIATSGTRKGDQLESPTAFFASWWAWKDFYKNIERKR